MFKLINELIIIYDKTYYKQDILSRYKYILQYTSENHILKKKS